MEACDASDWPNTKLTSEERNARAALVWMSTLLVVGAQAGSPQPTPSAQAQQGLRRVVDELLADDRSTHIHESFGEYLATNADGADDDLTATPGTEGPASNEPSRPLFASTTQPVDEFGDHLPYYQRGRAWVSELITAARQVHSGADDALAHEVEADRILDPLIAVANPGLLCDFIAGAAREAEDSIQRLRDDLYSRGARKTA
jgi:hypothetical protein